MTSDDDLLELARRFEEQALAEIYDRYNQGIYRYACRLLGNTDLAEECVSETFSRMLIALSQGKGPRKYLQAYLYRVAHNWITDQYRREPQPTLPLKTEFHSNPGLGPDEALTAANEQQAVRAALAKLTPDQRQVIVLKYIEGWRNREIAQALEKPMGAVKALKHRAVNALRRHLDVDDEVLK